MSLKVSEKKAISDPASKKDRIKSMKTKKINMLVAAGVIANKGEKKMPANS